MWLARRFFCGTKRMARPLPRPHKGVKQLILPLKLLQIFSRDLPSRREARTTLPSSWLISRHRGSSRAGLTPQVRRHFVVHLKNHSVFTMNIQLTHQLFIIWAVVGCSLELEVVCIIEYVLKQEEDLYFVTPAPMIMYVSETWAECWHCK